MCTLSVVGVLSASAKGVVHGQKRTEHGQKRTEHGGDYDWKLVNKQNKGGDYGSLDGRKFAEC